MRRGEGGGEEAGSEEEAVSSKGMRELSSCETMSAGKVSDDYDVSSRDVNVSSLSSSLTSSKEQSGGNALTSYNEYEKEMIKIKKRITPPHHNNL